MPNTSLLGLSNHKVMHELPALARSRILQYAAEHGGARHLCPMVEKECAKNLPTLDCSLDATWRELAIDIFGGPHASQVFFIDRWFNESNAHEVADGRPALTWRMVFQQLCSLYHINYLAVKNGTPLVTASKWMLGVFPRFREFPGAILGTARPDYLSWPALRPHLYFSRV